MDSSFIIKGLSFVLLFGTLSTTYPQQLSRLYTAGSALGYMPELGFHSPFEESAFLEWEAEGEPKRLKLLLATDVGSNDAFGEKVEQAIGEAIQFLEAKDIYAKKPKAQVNMIKKEAKKRFLKTYDVSSGFSEIFAQKKYNYFTATALYSLLLDYFEIPYVIRADAFVAFLIAFPGSLDETSIALIQPENIGMIETNAQYAYLGYLVNNNILKREKLVGQNVNSEEMFYQYYLPEESIYFHQLLGMIYMFKGLSANSVMNGELAVQNLEKAFILYPSLAMKYNLQTAHQINFSRINKNPKEASDSWPKLQKMGGTNELNETVAPLFVELTRKVVSGQLDSATYVYAYENLKLGSDSSLLKDINQFYFKAMANLEARHTKYEGALAWLDRLEDSSINNATRNLIDLYIGKIMEGKSPGEKKLKLKGLKEAYPSLEAAGVFE